jgi:hypothetical protein
LIYIEIITCLPFKKSQVTMLQQLEIKTLPSHQGKNSNFNYSHACAKYNVFNEKLWGGSPIPTAQAVLN